MKQITVKKLLKLNYDLYEDQALAWDKTRSEIWEKTVTDFILKIKPASSILDLGCGNARLYREISNIKSKNDQTRYLGIDPSESLIRIDTQKYPQANFKVGDGLTLKNKNQFDYVFCLAVLHHIPSKNLQLKFLQNIHDSLKDKGKLFLSVWNRWQPKYVRYMQDQKLYKDMEKTDTIVPWRQSNKSRYIHCFTNEELEDLARKSHFRNIKIFYANKKNITDQDKGLNIYLMAQK